MTGPNDLDALTICTYPVKAGTEFEHSREETTRVRGRTITTTRTFRGPVTKSGTVEIFDLCDLPLINACDANGDVLAVLTEVQP